MIRLSAVRNYFFNKFLHFFNAEHLNFKLKSLGLSQKQSGASRFIITEQGVKSKSKVFTNGLH